jgi:hypothetical protein
MAAKVGLISCLIISLVAVGEPFASHDYPRLANFFYSPVTIEQCRELSKWDVVVLTVGIQDYNPAMIESLRVMNPEITVLAYFPAGFVGATSGEHSPTVAGYVAKVDECDWYLYDDKANRVGDEATLWFTNLSPHCPPDGSGQTIEEWLAHYIKDEIISTNLWDGLVIDGLFINCYWINNWDHYFADPPAAIDADRDGVADSRDSLGGWWYGSVDHFLSTLRQEIGDSYVLVGNDKNYMSQYLNGGIREDFPHMHGGWEDNMFSSYGYVTMCNTWLQTPMNSTFMICFHEHEQNTMMEPYRSASYVYFLRFTLTSALLSDGYYFLEGGREEHLWWEDYYDIELGLPVGDAYRDSVWITAAQCYRPFWRREYEHASVICNPGPDWIMLEDHKLIAAEDGRIISHLLPTSVDMTLMRPSCERAFDQRDYRIYYDTRLVNSSEHAVFASVWARLTADGDTLLSGSPREFLIGAGDTLSQTLSIRIDSPIAPGTYCLEVFSGSSGQVMTDHDSIYVARIVDFEKKLHSNDDGTGEGSLVVFPQPTIATDGKVRLEVTGASSLSKLCSVRLFDVRGRFVCTIFEGELEEGESLELGISGKGGEAVVPGVYFVSAELGGHETITRKIVLLR